MAPPNDPALATLLSELRLLPAADRQAILAHFDSPERQRIKHMLAGRHDNAETNPLLLTPVLSERIETARKAIDSAETDRVQVMTRAAAKALIAAAKTQGRTPPARRSEDRHPSASLLDIAARRIRGAIQP